MFTYGGGLCQLAKKCKAHFPFLVEIDGKRRNLGNRRYCLECSPFGKHNTAKLEPKPKITECDHCGSKTNKRQPGRRTCYVCINHLRQEKKLKRLHEVVGRGCWKCGYNRDIRILDFHHMKDKKFELNARNVGQRSWKSIWAEAKKCVLLCCRCHRETHNGLLEVSDIYKKEWKRIMARKK